MHWIEKSDIFNDKKPIYNILNIHFDKSNAF